MREFTGWLVVVVRAYPEPLASETRSLRSLQKGAECRVSLFFIVQRLLNSRRAHCSPSGEHTHGWARRGARSRRSGIKYPSPSTKNSCRDLTHSRGSVTTCRARHFSFLLLSAPFACAKILQCKWRDLPTQERQTGLGIRGYVCFPASTENDEKFSKPSLGTVLRNPEGAFASLSLACCFWEGLKSLSLSLGGTRMVARGEM
jgi:hypothetical protein